MNEVRPWLEEEVRPAGSNEIYSEGISRQDLQQMQDGLHRKKVFLCLKLIITRIPGTLLRHL